MSAMTSNPASSSGLSVGDRLDKFEIVAQIGAGGTGVVWKGYDRLLDRHVAVKHLNPQLSVEGGEALRERFRAEAHLQRKLAQSDKHLVRVIDFLDEPRGLFIVMEFVDGPSLEQMLASQRGPMDARQAMGIVGAAAMALRAIHQQGVIHRDLKPSNILLPASGGLKVCDFGIASLVDDQEALSVGSVRYMAPECFADEAVDARADLYALGMVAYEMLVGREKFDEAFKMVLRDQRNAALRWMKWHTNPRAKAPPVSSLTKDTPPALDELVGRMIEKDAAARLSSAEELLEAIRRLYAAPAPQASVAGVARTDSGSTAIDVAPTAKLPTRSRWPTILAAVFALQLLALAGWWGYGQWNATQQARQRREQALERFEAARLDMQERRFDVALPVFEQLLAQWRDDAQLGRGSQERALWCRANLAADADRIDEARSALTQLESMGVKWGDLLSTLAMRLNQREAFLKEIAAIDGLIDAGQLDQARLRLRQQQGITYSDTEEAAFRERATRLEGQVSRARIAQVLAAARELVKQGKRVEASALLREFRERTPASEVERELATLNTDMSYDSAVAEGRKAQNEGRLMPAIQAFERARQIRDDGSLTQRIRGLLSQHAYERGRELESRGDMTGANDAYTRALGLNDQNQEARQALNRIKTADQRQRFFDAGRAAMGERNYEQAIAQLKLGLELGEDEWARTELSRAQLLHAVAQGQAALSRDDVEAAQARFSEALAIDPEHEPAQRGLSNVRTWVQYKALRDAGDKFRAQSRFREAKRDYRKARDVLETPAILKRLEEVEYESLIAAAKADMDAGAWATARANLLIALRMRDTPEAQELLQKVNANLPPETPSPAPQEEQP